MRDAQTFTIRYQDEILKPIVRPYAGAVGPGFLLVHDNARPYVAKVCRQFLEDEGIARHTSNRTPLGHYVSVQPTPTGCTSDCPGAQCCPGPDLGGNIPPSVVSLGACPDVVRHAYKPMGAIQTTEYHFELFSKMD